MERDEFVRRRGKPFIQPRVSGLVSAAVGVAVVRVAAVGADMKTYSWTTMWCRNMAMPGVQPAFELR